jgi:hypothetical protein
LSFLDFPLRPPKILWNHDNVSDEDYESPYINAIYFIVIFISFIVFAWVYHYIPDEGISAGLIGVSGAYLFLYKTIEYIYEAITDNKLDDDIKVEGSIAKEFLISLILFFGATFTLFLWGYSGFPLPNMIEVLHFFIAYFAGVVIKFLMIKLKENPWFMFIICLICLLALGYIFSTGVI